jgi:hypothetical protein
MTPIALQVALAAYSTVAGALNTPKEKNTMEIFSRNLIMPRKPYRAPKAAHFHLEPVGKGMTCDDAIGTFQTGRKALAVCPDGWEVVPCPFANHPEYPETSPRYETAKSLKISNS